MWKQAKVVPVTALVLSITACHPPRSHNGPPWKEVPETLQSERQMSVIRELAARQRALAEEQALSSPSRGWDDDALNGDVSEPKEQDGERLRTVVAATLLKHRFRETHREEATVCYSKSAVSLGELREILGFGSQDLRAFSGGYYGAATYYIVLDGGFCVLKRHATWEDGKPHIPLRLDDETIVDAEVILKRPTAATNNENGTLEQVIEQPETQGTGDASAKDASKPKAAHLDIIPAQARPIDEKDSKGDLEP